MANFATTFLLILAVFNVIATISLWGNWLDAMETSWAFKAFFASEAKAGIGLEIAASVLGGLVPAGLAFLASARSWPRRHLVHVVCGAWLIAYLLFRVPPLSVMWKKPFLEFDFGLGMWFRFHGFPAGTLVLSLILLTVAAIGHVRGKKSSPTQKSAL